MLVFERKFDVRCLESFIRSYTKNDTASFRIKVLGQEKNGDLMFCFDCYDISKGADITHIAIQVQATSQCKVLYSLDGVVEIVSCTINQPHSLILFTELQPRSAKGLAKSPGDYSLYMVHLTRNSPRKVPLKLQRPYHIEAHFLYGAASDKTHQAIVLIHTESVRQYRISVEGTEASPQQSAPQLKHETIFKVHCWYQWDASKQSLFLVHTGSSMRPLEPWLPDASTSSPTSPYCEVSPDSGSPPRSPFSLPRKISAYLVALAFSDKCSCRRLFECAVSIPPPSIGIDPKYDHTLLSGHSPDKKLNASVLASPCGAVVFCNQWPGVVSLHSDSEVVEYSITSLLHGRTLHVTVPNIATTNRKPQVFFSLYRDYVLVYLPGTFVHVIDVNIHMEMTYHVISDVKCSHRAGRCKRLSGLRLGRRSQHAIDFYDSSEGCAYSVQLSPRSLLELFSTCQSQLVRSAILRMALLYFSETGMVNKIMLMMRNDAASSETQVLLAEYILGSAYVDMQSRLSVLAGCLLPFTLADVYRTEKIRVSTVELTRVKLTYSSERGVDFLVDQRHARSEEEWWHSCNCQLIARKCCSRLTARSVFTRRGAQATSEPAEPGARRSHIFGKFLDFVSRKERQRKSASDRLNRTRSASTATARLQLQLDDAGPGADGACGSAGEAPALLTGSDGQQFKEPSPESVLYRMLDLLAKKSSEIAPAVAAMNPDSGSLTNVVTDYVSAICVKLQQLPVVLWSQFNLVMGSDCTIKGLQEDIAKAFQMFERYYSAVTELGLPVSQGFSTVFTILGYQALPPRIFLQYVDCGILTVAGHSQQLLWLQPKVSEASFGDGVQVQSRKDCTTGDDTVLAQCISKLPEADAYQYCMLSREPWALKHVASRIVNDSLSPDGSWLQRPRSNSVRSSSGVASEPANTGRRHVVDYGVHGAFQTFLQELKALNVDEDLLGRAAFAYASECYQSDRQLGSAYANVTGNCWSWSMPN